MPKQSARQERLRHRQYRHNRKRWLWLFLLLGLSFLTARYISASRLINRTWRYNILVSSRPALLLLLSPLEKDNQAAIFLPENAYVSVPYGYGKYRLDGLLTLAEIEKKPEIFAQSVGNLLYQPVSSVVYTDIEFSDQPVAQMLTEVRSKLSLRQIMVGTGGLNLLDRLYLVLAVVRLRLDKTDIYKLYKDDALLKNEILADGSQVKVPDMQAISAFFLEKFQDETVRSENLSVEVHNPTGVSGIGNIFARIIRGWGGQVISIASTDGEVPQNCRIEANGKHQRAKLIEILKTDFGCEFITGHKSGQADIVVTAGTELSRRWQTAD